VHLVGAKLYCTQALDDRQKWSQWTPCLHITINTFKNSKHASIYRSMKNKHTQINLKDFSSPLGTHVLLSSCLCPNHKDISTCLIRAAPITEAHSCVDDWQLNSYHYHIISYHVTHLYQLILYTRWRNGYSVGLAINRSLVRILIVTTLGKLFTPMCLCHQACTV